MKSSKNLLKISGMLNSILGILAYKIPFFSVVLLATGIYLYLLSSNDEKKLYPYRNALFILAFLMIPFNFISSIMLFLASDYITRNAKANGINAPPKVIYKIDPEKKKIDLLVKLGIGMVFISGCLFATTTWEFIINPIKAIVLLFLATLFIFLSVFTEKKLKLYRTAYIYWLLSIIFFIFTIVGVLYFGIFGTYLTYSSAGKYLAYFITYITSSALLYVSYLKFSKKTLLYASYAGVFISLYNILKFIELPPLMIISILSLIVMLINIISKKNNSLFEFSKIISLILFALIITNINIKEELYLSIACIINCINLNYLTIREKNESETIFHIVMTYILIFIGIMPLTVLSNYNGLFISLITALYTLLINSSIIPSKDETKLLNYILHTVSTLIVFVLAVDKRVELCPVIAIIYIYINEIAKFGLFTTKKIEISKYLEPISLLLLVSGIYAMIDTTSITPVLIAVSFIYCILNIFHPSTEDKNIYFVSALIATFFAIISPDTHNDLLYLVSTIPSLYLFYKAYMDENNKIYLLISYIVLLTSIFIPYIVHGILMISPMIITLIFIAIMILISLILKNDIITKVTLFYIVLPIFHILHDNALYYDMMLVIKSILYLYILFIILKLFVHNNLTKNVLAIFGIIYSIIGVFFTNSITIGVYIGILGVIIIIIGYLKHELSPLFKFGIILTVLNIIYQLHDLWNMVPFWLYLLIGGLSILGFVTLKEVQKQKSK